MNEIVDQIIITLENNEQMYIPSGWTTLPTGHAISIIIQKQYDNKYKVIIINTGGGGQYHPQIYNNNTNRAYVQAIVTHENVEKENLKKFLMNCILNRKKGDDYIFYEIGMKYLMERGDTYEPAKAEDVKYYYPEQLSGSCTFRGIYLPLYYGRKRTAKIAG